MEEIEEQIAKAEEANESQVVVEADKDLDVAMTPTQLKSAGYVYIYDTVTHERSLCNRNMLPRTLRKTRPDGSIVFTTIKPKAKPQRGHLKCMLHPDVRLPLYDEWGLAVCKKSNLTSPYQVRRHMQKRHKAEYEAIREEEARIEKDRERQLREAILASQPKAEPPLYVKEEKKKK